MSTETDPKTGLPDVGPGYFWRIKRWNSRGSKYSLMVQLRERRWYGSRKVEDSLSEHNPAAILNSCHLILNNTARQRNKIATIGQRMQYIGDYPPKTLPKETR